jgi:hypothetical protein
MLIFFECTYIFYVSREQNLIIRLFQKYSKQCTAKVIHAAASKISKSTIFIYSLMFFMIKTMVIFTPFVIQLTAFTIVGSFFIWFCEKKMFFWSGVFHKWKNIHDHCYLYFVLFRKTVCLDLYPQTVFYCKQFIIFLY